MFDKLVDAVKSVFGKGVVKFHVKFVDGSTAKGSTRYVGSLETSSLSEMEHTIREQLRHKYPLRRVQDIQIVDIVRER